VNRFASNHDAIFWYRKSEKYTFEPQKEERDKPVLQMKRTWDKEKGRVGKYVRDKAKERAYTGVGDRRDHFGRA
jgi:hypothetical protein